PSGGRLRVTAPLPSHMVQTWNLLVLDLAGAERDAE
ncbi:RluA family pseudouridine synthase, partial [Rhizobium leguminosarum]